MVQILRRFFHTGSYFALSLAEKAAGSTSGALAALRKKTGYSLANCKKALDLHNHDVEKAESWLHSQAQEQGWAKASKLQSRQATQGLVGVSFSSDKASIVEVNCETDFVARNEKFQSLVATVANSVLSTSQSAVDPDVINKVDLSGDDIGKLPQVGSGTLSDLVALTIGNLGENMVLRRAVAIQRANPSIEIVCHTHPLQQAADSSNTLFGKYGAVVVLQRTDTNPPAELPEGIALDKLPKQIAQHIIGMNPTKVGTKDDPRAPTSDEETLLYHQEFVANPDYTVGELLDQVGLKVVDFVRFECGESK